MAPRNGEKRGGLTLEKLASYDDIITDALVDKVGCSSCARDKDGREQSTNAQAEPGASRSTTGPPFARTAAGASLHRADCTKKTLPTSSAATSYATRTPPKRC